MRLAATEFQGRKFYFRKGTTDINCIKEVLLDKGYKNRNVPFYIESNEVWLDLGAHIGTFVIYAYSCGAKKVICFEGYEDNYRILKKNCPKAKKYKAFFTASKDKKLPMYRPTKKNDFYRFTAVKNKRLCGFVNNFYAGNFKEKVDGIKMDIEGSEFDLIEKDLLPESKKLVMEYHFSKDESMKNFFDRMEKLKTIYDKVYYQNSIKKLKEKQVKSYPGFYDIKVFCIKEEVKTN